MREREREKLTIDTREDLLITPSQLCRAEELELLICGSTDLDFTELQRITVYLDGYHDSHPTIMYSLLSRSPHLVNVCSFLSNTGFFFAERFGKLCIDLPRNRRRTCWPLLQAVTGYPSKASLSSRSSSKGMDLIQTGAVPSLSHSTHEIFDTELRVTFLAPSSGFQRPSHAFHVCCFLSMRPRPSWRRCLSLP